MIDELIALREEAPGKTNGYRPPLTNVCWTIRFLKYSRPSRSATRCCTRSVWGLAPMRWTRGNCALSTRRTCLRCRRWQLCAAARCADDYRRRSAGLRGDYLVRDAGPCENAEPILNPVHDTFAKVINTPELRARLESQGTEPGSGSALEFGELIRREYQRNAKVVKISGAKID
jgi:hypothetical protein